MSVGRVIHEQVAERDHARRRMAQAGQATGAAIARSEEWCRRHIPESVQGSGVAHARVVGAAMALRWIRGEWPSVDDVVGRVRTLYPWVLEDTEEAA